MMKNHKPSSLTAHFGRLLLLSAAAGILLFLCLRLGGEVLLTHYIETSDYQVRATEKQVREFQSYVSEKELAVRDSDQITKWVRRHAPILMEIYRDNVLLYSSSAPEELEGNDEVSPSYDWISYYQVHFADGAAEVVSWQVPFFYQLAELDELFLKMLCRHSIMRVKKRMILFLICGMCYRL